MKLIENTSELISFCQELNRKPFIAVDLEFLREKSYYAKLCLIQVAAPDTAAIIDPLAPGIELEAFFAILHNPEVVKVFHSGRQDIEIIYHQAGFIPEPLFDTQTAAQVFGFGEAISYENLVKPFSAFSWTKAAAFPTGVCARWTPNSLNMRFPTLPIWYPFMNICAANWPKAAADTGLTKNLPLLPTLKPISYIPKTSGRKSNTGRTTAAC